MDFLKQAQGALGNVGGQNQNQQAQQQQNPAGGAVDPNQQQQQQGGVAGQPGQPGAATGQQDALDKGIGSLLTRAGHGQNVQTTEKISDGVRSAFKSATGRDIPIQDKQ